MEEDGASVKVPWSQATGTGGVRIKTELTRWLKSEP